MSEEFQELGGRTVESLKEAQRHIQSAQRCIGEAMRLNALTGNERKLLNRVKADLIEVIEALD